MSIFNRQYNTIFIHIPKTAGSSMQAVLGHGGHETIYHFMEQDGFDGAFKFAFVRNPWDRFISLRFHKQQPQPQDHLKSQHEFICDGQGNILVDFVGRFETLEADWQHVCRTLGIIESLPYIRKGNHDNYMSYYTPELWNEIAEKYQRDIEIFGYEGNFNAIV